MVGWAQALLRCCGVLVQSMGAAETGAALQGPLMPALVREFGQSSADVRKAVSSLLQPLCCHKLASLILEACSQWSSAGAFVLCDSQWHGVAY